MPLLTVAITVEQAINSLIAITELVEIMVFNWLNLQFKIFSKFNLNFTNAYLLDSLAAILSR